MAFAKEDERNKRWVRIIREKETEQTKRKEESMNRTNEVIREGPVFLLSVDGKNALNREFERAAIPELSHVYTGAFYLTKDRTEAEDLVQETYLRAFRFFTKFQPGTNCRAWLLSILRNLFANRYRQKRQEPEIVDWEEMDQAEKPQDGNARNFLISQSMDEEVDKALRDLPEEFRTAIVLVDIEESSYEMAARVMECPIGTVRSRVSRGRRMLQVALRNYALQRGIIR